MFFFGSSRVAGITVWLTIFERYKQQKGNTLSMFKAIRFYTYMKHHQTRVYFCWMWGRFIDFNRCIRYLQLNIEMNSTKNTQTTVEDEIFILPSEKAPKTKK